MSDINPHGPFPQPFGRYTVESLLGMGGMATVYRATDTILGRRVALKIPHPDLMEETDFRVLFQHEARAGAVLVHDNICRILDFGTFEGTPYLSMDYVHGNKLAVGEPWEWSAAVRLAGTLARAMAVTHGQAIIHRDLKPSNILLTPEGRPVIMDFGLALRLNQADAPLPRRGQVIGTLAYMPPEQVETGVKPLGPGCDVYSLGMILYQLLTGQVAFTAQDPVALIEEILVEEPVPPSRLRPGLIPPSLDQVCLKALAKEVEERFASMDDFARALEQCLTAPASGPVRDEQPAAPRRPRVPPNAIHFAFAPHGDRAPPSASLRDRLYLDVGNDLRPGVIDHHQEMSFGSCARHVLNRPDLIDAVVDPGRRPEAPFTLVVHQDPDFDCVVSAFLACAYLGGQRFPAGSELLAYYADRVDEGALGMSLTSPFSLYAAFERLKSRPAGVAPPGSLARWQQCMRDGVNLVGYVLTLGGRTGKALPNVNAFDCPKLFTVEDRRAVLDDLKRYRRKLADPRCRARMVRVRLPGRFGGREEVEALLVRDVQNDDDPERCLFFKDWARTDARCCANKRGFVALCVFMSEGVNQKRRCILSVTPDSRASLRGLAELLDKAEGQRRRELHGEDDRVRDPVTGIARAARPGATNADPWYDGRGHGYTIVDAPHGGTELTADEIEALFLEFGR